MNEKRGQNKEIINSLSLSSVGINLVVSTMAGLALGLWLDKVFNIKPVLTLLFFFLGIIAGFVNIVREVNRINHESDNQKKNS